jgi:hypothetical protein
VLDLRQYFNGPVDAYGIFTDRSGKVVKRFTVMKCRWNGAEGVLEEDFTYSDGTEAAPRLAPDRSSQRPLPGRADDVVGEAVGESAGNALNWRYTWPCPWTVRSITCSSTTGCT